jgi:site-specific DNA recombinase
MDLDGYTRVSRVNGREGDSFISPDVQREKIAGYAKALGHRIVDWHEDLNQSGGRDDRPGLLAALERVERGETAGIAVAKLDRFARSQRGALEALGRLEAAGGVLISVEDSLDTSTPMGRAMRQILFVFAELELERRREDFKTSRRRAVEKRGIHIASRVPSGYRKRPDGRLQVHKRDAAAIRKAYQQRAAGVSWSKIADMLSEKRVESPYGASTWTLSATKKLVGNRVYLGEARSGEYVNADAHEPIVSRAEWDAAQGARAPTPTVTEGLLLSGLVRCAGCRYLMRTDKMTDGKGERLSFYRCRKRHPGGVCPAPASTLARVLDPLVEEVFLREIADPQGPFAEASQLLAVIEEAQKQLDDAEHELGEYMAVSVTGVGRAAYQDGLDARVGAVEEARRELAEARQRSALAATVKLTPGELVEAWPELTVPERREVLAATLDCVVVSQGRKLPIGERVRVYSKGAAPADLPRRGRRLPLAPFDDRPGDVRVAAA